MALNDITALSADKDFALRTTAAYARETLGQQRLLSPEGWQSEHAWDMAVQPGFAEAYAYALAKDPPNERPGYDPSVITDGMILSGIQGIIAAEAAVPPPA